MSSWYILSSLGIYSVCPGTDQYVLGSPVFRKATITMEDGRKFVIEADGNSQQNVYIQSATLNGKPLDKNYITYKDIADGGVMRLVMGPEPNKERGTGKDAAPFLAFQTRMNRSTTEIPKDMFKSLKTISLSLAALLLGPAAPAGSKATATRTRSTR